MVAFEDKALLRNAQEAAQQAYAPYSEFLVGAALLAQGGRVFTGCNIENASYGLTICAERVALFKAVSAGEREFVKLALWAAVPCWPCGACLQCLAEFAPNIQILRSGDGEKIEAKNLAELFPAAFRLECGF